MSSLGNDLANLREEQDLTLEDLQDKTKIPVRVLQSIEDDSIFSKINENKTYIRSFIRSYGRALGIDDRLLRIALDQTEADQYQDLLQKVDPFNPGEITDEPPFSIPQTDSGKKRTTQKKRSGSPSSQPARDRTASSTSSYTQQDNYPEESINWADVGRRFKSIEKGSRIWIILVFIVIAVGLIGYFFLFDSQRSNQSMPTADSLASIEQDLSSDSMQLAGSDTDQDSVMQNPSTEKPLPDTIKLVIHAARGKLEPVRVKSDLFSEIYPYWIEQGEGMRFNFTDTIRVRGQFGRMILMMNDKPIPNFPQAFEQDDEFAIITRSYFEQNQQWNNTPADTFPTDVARPDTIYDRPTFNQEEGN